MLSVCVVTLPACRSLRLDSRTRIAEVRAFPSEKQRATLDARLVAQLSAIDTAFAAGDKLAHSRQTLDLLLYSRSIPIFYLDSFLPTLLEHMGKNEVEANLSFYLDFGLRLSCLKTPDATWRLRVLADHFPATPPRSFDRQAVFLRQTCSARSEFRAYSDNVGWAVASMFYSEFGRNFTLHSELDMRDLLELVQTETVCSNCQPDGTLGSHPPAGLTGATPGAETSCPAIGAGMAAGMKPGTQKSFCSATRNLGGAGFGGSSVACLKFAKGLAERAGWPGRPDTLERWARFEDYVSCKGRQFNHESHSPFYDAMSRYFDGDGDLRRLYGRKIKDKDGRTTYRRPLEPGRVRPSRSGITSVLDKASGTLLSEEAYFFEDGLDKALRYEATATDFGSGTRTDTELLDTPGGSSEKIVTRDSSRKTTTTYKQNGRELRPGDPGYEEAARKHADLKDKYFPPKPKKPKPKPNSDPSPDDPQSPCDSILDESQPPIRPPDNDPLIQHEPDHVTREFLEPLQQCLQSFESSRQCPTILRCGDDPEQGRCGCRSFDEGSPGPTPQCPLIQCAADARIVNCMCVNGSGGIIPGLNGPLTSIGPLPDPWPFP